MSNYFQYQDKRNNPKDTMDKRRTSSDDEMDPIAYEDLEHETFNEGLQDDIETDIKEESEPFPKSERQTVQRTNPPLSVQPVRPAPSQTVVQPVRPVTAVQPPAAILPRQTVKVELPPVLRPRPAAVRPVPPGTPQVSGMSPFGPVVKVPPPSPATINLQQKPPRKPPEKPLVSSSVADPYPKPVPNNEISSALPRRTYETQDHSLLVIEGAVVVETSQPPESLALKEEQAMIVTRKETEEPHRSPAAPEGGAEDTEIHTPTLASNQAQSSAVTSSDVLTLDQLIAQFRGIPDHTAVLGVCEDGLPVLFDMLDDAPGALLVMGDSGSGKTHLVQSLLRTAAAYNSSVDFTFSAVVSHPNEYEAFEDDAHCLGIFNLDSDQGWDQILHLAAVTEKCYQEGKAGSPVLLVLDDLQNLPRMDNEVRLNLEWLFKYGPNAHVWPLVVLPTQAALRLGRFTSHFRTRILGCMPDEASRRLGLFSGLQAHSLQQGQEFAVYVNDNWMKFNLPVWQNETH